MLLGVSRQSVTKWEAEKSYPEMDKLLKLCQIFECSLDDLVQGDLTGRACASVAAAVPAGPPTDICGYDEHMRTFAFQIATGVAIVLLGVAVAAGLDGTLKALALSLPGNAADALPVILMFICIAISLAFFIPAGMEHDAFCKAHPYIEDFYTQAEKDEARRHVATALVVGIAIIFAGLGIIQFFEDTAWEDAMGGIFLLFVATGVWIMVHWSMLAARTNVIERNKEVAEDLEIDDIVNAQIDAEVKESLLAAKQSARSRKGRLISTACGVIMLLATIVALCWLFIPMFDVVAQTGDWDSIDGAAATAKTSLFWLPWVIGGICCGIATLLIEAFYPEG